MYADYSDLQLSSPLTGVRMFKGPENIARAMMRYGAMTCGIDVTPAFQSGTGVLWQEGVYTGVTADPGTEIPEGATSNIGSHAVVCYGFGTTDSGIPYWECLNNWGSTWGTGGNGHFKLRQWRSWCGRPWNGWHPPCPRRLAVTHHPATAAMTSRSTRMMFTRPACIPLLHRRALRLHHRTRRRLHRASSRSIRALARTTAIDDRLDREPCSA